MCPQKLLILPPIQNPNSKYGGQQQHLDLDLTRVKIKQEVGKSEMAHIEPLLKYERHPAVPVPTKNKEKRKKTEPALRENKNCRQGSPNISWEKSIKGK